MQAAHRLWECSVLAPKLCLGVVLESISWPEPKMCQGSLQQFDATGSCGPELRFIFWHYSTCYLLEPMNTSMQSLFLPVCTRCLQGAARHRGLYTKVPLESFRWMVGLSNPYLWLILSLLLQNNGALSSSNYCWEVLLGRVLCFCTVHFQIWWMLCTTTFANISYFFLSRIVSSLHRNNSRCLLLVCHLSV